MLMEPDKNPFPKFELISLPRLCRVAHFIFDHLQHDGLSDHNTGAGPALDAALYDSRAEALNNMNQVYFPEQAE